MALRPRMFSSALSARERSVYGVVTLILVVTFFATLWPVYTLFSRVTPRVLGLPFSLASLVGLVVLCFASMLFLYVWEDRNGKLDE